MATVLTKPDALSLSGNMKKFILSTSALVSFILKKGTQTIIERTYEPATDGRVTIDLQDVVENELSFFFTDTQAIYTQPNLVADFTAVIDGVSYPFRVIRAGVAAFNNTPANFLTYNFLTWQPTRKKVTYYTPEFLTYYATVNCTVQLRAYFEGNETLEIKLADLTASNAYTIPLQYGIVAGKFNHRLPGAYDVWVQDPEGNRLTYIQRYQAEGMRSEHEAWILFENSLGGIDTFRAYGEQELNAEHTHNFLENDHILSEYRTET
ncbi:MAG: hypothetical protein LUG98_09745, partial [Tannerellaceae bacterium]|nr:hypothetical protein [Tannerellaceae bacterium]